MKGPGDGEEGLRKNVQRVREVREQVGPDFPIMIDCYMSLVQFYFDSYNIIDCSIYN